MGDFGHRCIGISDPKLQAGSWVQGEFLAGNGHHMDRYVSA